jgi:hypothetical protein
MSAKGVPIYGTVYEQLRSSAEGGSVIIAEVFSAMHRGDITEEQAKEIITAYERASIPGWQRFLGSTSS